MDMKRTYKFSLRRKLVIFTTILAIVTYSTSAFFLYFLSEYFTGVMSEQLFTILTLGAGIFWSGILAYFAARFITKPLMQLEQVAIKAANGHINEDAPLSKSDDEIRSLGIAFNQMLNSIRVMVRNIEDNFEKTNSKVIEIGKASSTATTQTESIAQTITEISAGADGSANAVQTTAQSMEDIQKVAITVQDKAKSSEQLSNEMAMKLNESRMKLQSLISGIQQLANSNETSFQAVHRLKKHAQEIEHISSLVGDIAGQTNLLALNASIEAARAGEHGKGFAVVAEEVRKLADECAKAVQGINSLIQNIQTEVKAVVTLISTQKEVTNKEVANAAQTNEAIMTMTTSSNEVVEAVKDISALVDKQMKIVESTVIQSQEVAAIAEQTSAGAQEVAASTKQQINVMENIETLSNELASEAQKLNQTIQKFVYNKNDN